MNHSKDPLRLDNRNAMEGAHSIIDAVNNNLFLAEASAQRPNLYVD
jgi:hypothetical protein